MKKIRNFIPQIRQNRNIFIKKIIEDVIDALVGFFIGSAIEAIFNLEIVKAIIFIFCYIIFAFFFRMHYQKKINDKDNLILKKDRGIKKLNSKNIYERGLVIIIVIILSKINLAVLFLLMFLAGKILYKNFIKENLIYGFFKSNL